MSSWNHNIRSEIEFLHDFNAAAMVRAGFGFDKGRTLSEEEVQKLNLTQPSEIRDCGFKPEYYWR
jgi:hypothetical protein